jgi:hypothetical protein
MNVSLLSINAQRFLSRYQKIYYTVCLLLLAQGYSQAQVVSDSLRQKVDKQSSRDSVRYAKLKNKMSGGLGGTLWGFLFQDAYIDTTKKQEINPHIVHQGKVIRNIIIKRLDVFGPEINDTIATDPSFFERLGNKLHRETREATIRKYFLLFKEGDTIDPQQLWDNERLIRRNNDVFSDAKIFVIPDKTTNNIVDILLITKDIWSLIPEPGFSPYYLNISQRNFRGLAHRWDFIPIWDTNPLFTTKLAFETTYRIPSLIPRSFVTAEATLAFTQRRTYIGGRVFRPFLTADTKWAGSVELAFRNDSYDFELRRLRDRANNDSTVIGQVRIPRDYFLADAWLGRSFKITFGSENFRRNSRLILATRFSMFGFTARPDSTSATKYQAYQNRRDWLITVGFSNREYIKDNLIYGFGRTEDVPVGFSAGFIYGRRSGEFTKANYVGASFSKGQYFKKFGYVYGIANVGGFLNQDNQVEQGVFSLAGNYFSPLQKWGRKYYRHFFNIQYGVGINRYSTDFLSINLENGIPDINSARLYGNQKIVLNYESVLFTRLSFVGFRVAPFAFVSAGLVNLKGESLSDSPVYTGFGLGLRFRNDNLTFNTFQLRFGYYPNIPYVQAFSTIFGSTQSLRLPDFDISAPQFLPFR